MIEPRSKEITPPEWLTQRSIMKVEHMHRTNEPSACHAEKPWLALYGPRAAHIAAEHADMLSIFRQRAESSPLADAIRYFDGVMSYQWLDAQSDALAVWFADEMQVCKGDRVAVLLQNVPEFAIATVAAWKLGAVPMPVNPAYREAELARLFADGSPRAVLCHDEVHAVVAMALRAVGRPDAQIMTASAHELQHRHDRRVLPPPMNSPDGAMPIHCAISARNGQRPPSCALSPSDPGLLLYTSGTTGEPKGAVLSHGAMAFNAQTATPWFGLQEAGRILAIAPLFHITGFQIHLCAAFLSGSAMVMCYRFEPRVVLDMMLEHQPTFMIGAITAYIALLNVPEASREHFACFDSLYSGGAPVPPAVVDTFESRFGRRIATAYGMTETCAQTHVAPYEARIPVNTASGALSIGVPISSVEALVVGPDGRPAAIGEAGELLVRGPMLMDGYLNKPDASREALANGWMQTGDIAFMDAQGWFYVVDRKKDMIIASGFKVWPREVEDVLYRHPAVREAAIVGITDPYRGETVKAYVSLVQGKQATEDELIQQCRTHLTGYKVPRSLEILPELPKTASGKIMRAELRKRKREARVPA